MPIRLSSGLRSAMVSEYGLERMMRRGFVRIYTGPQPLSADNAPTGNLIATITTNGLSPAPGVIAPGLLMQPGDEPGSMTNSGEWVLKGIGSGIAGWWRFVWNSADDDGASEFLPRIDGAVGESLLLDDVMITPQTERVIQDFFLYLPGQ